MIPLSNRRIIYLKSMDKEVKVLESKDKPKLLKFKCSDNIERKFLLKNVGSDSDVRKESTTVDII